MVTGWPEVNETPYNGAVVLYRVLQRRPPGAEHPVLARNCDCGRSNTFLSVNLSFILLYIQLERIDHFFQFVTLAM